jgi:hypothetical protein
MNAFISFLRDFKSDFSKPPVAIKSGNVKPAPMGHVESREDIKKVMSAGLARDR